MRNEIINANIDLKNLPDYESISGHIIPREMAANIALTHVIEEKFWYCTEAGAAAYIELNRSKKGYKMYKETLDILQKNLPSMMDKIFRIFVEWDGEGRPEPKNMISFGIAGGGKEMAILDALMKCCVRSLPIRFVPVELSYPLLLYGLRQVQKKFHEDIDGKRLVVRAAVTDYNKAQINDFAEKGHRLITILGVIVNAEMDKFFTSIKKLMNEKTLLLMDVETIDGRTDEEMCSSYRDIDTKKFIFSPLNMLGDATRNEKRAHGGGGYMEAFDIFSKIKFRKEDIVTEVVTAKTLDAFMKKYDLPILAKNMIRVNDSEESRTVMIVYAPKGGPAYVLGHSTRLEKDNVRRVLETHGFEIRGEWSEPDAHNTYYLISLKGP